ncbi:MAG: hypothetical protein JRI68_25565 [Deltaproteobacteria bacterium]|nr:hypothetical protein [Deltaproteobacteria bacterium]
MKGVRTLPALVLFLATLVFAAGCPEETPTGDDAGGGRDAGLSDVSADAAVLDAVGDDTAATDTGVPDTAIVDAAVADAAIVDTAVADVVPADSGGSDLVQPDVALPDVGSQPYLQVVSPNGGESLPVGFDYEISWISANLADTVFIYYSKDFFTSDVNVIAADHLDTGSYTWTVPDDLSINVRVKVAASMSPDTVFDFSDLPFSIVDASITVTSPNGGETLLPFGGHEITWTSEHVLGDVRIEYSRDDFVAEAIEIVAATPNDGTFTWDPVSGDSSDSLKIRISAVGNPAIFDVSDAVWAIESWIQLTSPNGGEELSVGAQPVVTWVSSQDNGLVELHYSKDNFVSDVHEIYSHAADTGSFRWGRVPNDVSSTVRVRAAFFDAPEIYDISDADLSIREGGWARFFESSTMGRTPLAINSLGEVYVGLGHASGIAHSTLKVGATGRSIGGWSLRDPTTSVSDIAVDSDDGVYLLGRCDDICDIDPGFGVFDVGDGTGSIFVAKLDAQGDFVWGRGIDGITSFGRISVFQNSAVAISGVYSGAPDLDPAPGSGELPLAENRNGFVAAFDAAGGAFSWVQSWGGDGYTETRAVTHDSGGNVFVGGYFGGAEVDFNPGPGETLFSQLGQSTAYVVRYTALGTFTTLRAFGGTGINKVEDLILDGSDNIYVIGSFGGAPGEAVDLDTRPASSYNLTVVDDEDGFVARYDPSFFIDSAVSFGGSARDILERGALCGTGELRVLGRSSSVDADLDPGPTEQIPGSRVTYLATFDAGLSWSATRHWASSHNSDQGLACDDLGYTYLAGAPDGARPELAPVDAPCLADSVNPDTSGYYLIKYMPDLCW